MSYKGVWTAGAPLGTITPAFGARIVTTLVPFCHLAQEEQTSVRWGCHCLERRDTQDELHVPPERGNPRAHSRQVSVPDSPSGLYYGPQRPHPGPGKKFELANTLRSVHRNGIQNRLTYTALPKCFSPAGWGPDRQTPGITFQ